MALRDVLLGLLVDHSDHGYSLKRRLSPGLPADRLINDGVLYPLLGRMEDEGLLTVAPSAAGRSRATSARGAAGHGLPRLLRSDADEDLSRPIAVLAHPLVKLLFSDHLSEDERMASSPITPGACASAWRRSSGCARCPTRARPAR